MDHAAQKIIEGLVDLGFKLVGLVLILVIGFRISKIIIKLLKERVSISLKRVLEHLF